MPPLSEIDLVVFYKRDELTTDLICCDIHTDGTIWFCHEEAQEWEAMLAQLGQLPRFDDGWYARVVHPPFVACRTVAYCRAGHDAPSV